MKPPFEGWWNLARVCGRDGETWKVREDNARCIERVSWYISDYATVVERNIGARLRCAAYEYDAGNRSLTLDWENRAEAEQYTVETGGDAFSLLTERDGAALRYEFVRQADTPIQRAVNEFITRSRTKPMSEYPIELVRAMRLTDIRTQLPPVAGSDTDAFFSFRFSEEHIGLLVFIHAYTLYQQKMNRAKTGIPKGARCRKYMQYAEIVERWLILYDSGVSVPKIWPQYIERYDEYLAVLRGEFRARGMKYASPFHTAP